MSDLPPYDAPDVDPDLARRLTAAFGALATGEVPDTAPRPAAAPRPRPGSTSSTRRRWAVAGGSVLVAAAAVVVAVLLGTQVFAARVATTGPPATGVSTPSGAPVTTPAPSTPRTPSTSTSTSIAPDPAAVAAAFVAVSNGTRSAVVTVPGGYEAADLIATTTIRLWTSSDGLLWRQAGSSGYPPPFGGGAAASIKAAGLPTGAPHALFVVADQGATGDSSGVDVSFGVGTAGFGAVKGGADGDLRLSGSGVAALGDIGTSYSEDLEDGLLVTAECSVTVAQALCGEPGNRIVKYWRWGTESFVLDHRTGPAS